MDDVKGYDRVNQAREWMCAAYWDVRTFGALMTSGRNAGQVRGPVQMTFARSVDPILIIDNCIVRQAVATIKDSDRQNGENRTMGRKYIVPYALYVGQGYVSANLAAQSGFSEEDLELLWAGLENMFEDDRSAARGRMSVRKLIIFRHQSKLGNAQSDLLFDAIKITRHDPETPARSFSDYKVTIDKSAIPKGVELIERV